MYPEVIIGGAVVHKAALTSALISALGVKAVGVGGTPFQLCTTFINV